MNYNNSHCAPPLRGFCVACCFPGDLDTLMRNPLDVAPTHTVTSCLPHVPHCTALYTQASLPAPPATPYPDLFSQGHL